VRETLDKLHVQAARNYTFKPYPGQGVTLVRASKQPLGIVPDPTMGWGALLNGQLKLHEIPAHHQNIPKEPGVRTLAQQLTTCMDRVRKESNVGLGAGQKAS
jgi:thioesterase domain-containing protein